MPSKPMATPLGLRNKRLARVAPGQRIGVGTECNPIGSFLVSPCQLIPDAVYERLKVSAKIHRRSLNSEAIVCLESVLLPAKTPPSEHLARTRKLRAALPQGKFNARDIDTVQRQDRP